MNLSRVSLAPVPPPRRGLALAYPTAVLALPQPKGFARRPRDEAEAAGGRCGQAWGTPRSRHPSGRLGCGGSVVTVYEIRSCH